MILLHVEMHTPVPAYLKLSTFLSSPKLWASTFLSNIPGSHYWVCESLEHFLYHHQHLGQNQTGYPSEGKTPQQTLKEQV